MGNQLKDTHVLLRINQKQKSKWKLKADLEKKPLSDWIRSKCESE
jgi:hypothetical protein